ncbi:uncharacterized protein LOC111679316 [Lucilia cuprina]|uniref:uncharacterized protein LOC111679316 n=1 Tax=Lucilia cuprina TaxID=7375 RepID=UPI001F06040C|nr:uncharacterized protein LOC111679316 [Lucilia cuprina]
MMPQTKYKYFNKKIKMMLLLLILMWSLMGQHVYGKSSSYDIGIVNTAADAANSATADVAADDSVYDTNGIRDMIQENIAKIKTTKTKDAKKETSEATSTTTENKGKNNNTATIYDRINENDNNSNKLPQNVAKREDQQQSNMMYMNMKMPAPLPSPSSASSSSSISTTTTTTSVTATTIPPTESLLMPKDQLNKTESEIPKSNEKDNNNKNSNNETENKNKPEESIESKMSTLKVNDTSNSNESAANSGNKVSKNNNINNETATSESNNLNETDSNNQNKIDDGEKNDKNEADPEIDNENSNGQFDTFDSTAQAQQMFITQFALKFKQIPRVTFFTCKEPAETTDQSNEQQSKTNNFSYKRHTHMNLEMVKFVRRMYTFDEDNNESSPNNVPNSPSIMMNVVLIDHLLNKNRASTSSSVSRVGFGRASSFGAAAASGPATRNAFTNANWLEQILKPEAFCQIVVLDLACGGASRRLLEMASNKAFFNSMYHWLLLEDYVFNRQTEIDDADDDDIESKMNNYSTEANTKKSSKEEIVNDSNATILQVKKLSTYPSDVIGASTSGFGLQNKVTPTTTLSSSSSTSTTKTVAGGGGIRQKQRIVVDDKSSASSNASRTAGVTDEDDIEIIEKFLEKLNININTELILAKRRMRALATTSYPSDATPAPPSLTNSTLTESDDYNTLQKMDYYLLYDVWNPGLQYGGEMNMTEIGYFSRNKGFQVAHWYKTTTTIMRRINMDLAKVRCLVVITHKNRSDTLEEYLTSHYDTHLDSMNRFNFALLSHVRELFNFSFILSKTATWGYLKNGKFDGMIGALVRKQADIGGSPIFFRIERAKVIDYTSRTWVARPCFIFRHPRSTKKDRIVFLQPFSNDVWVFLAVCGFITIFLLWVLTSLERKFDPDEFEANTGTDMKAFERLMSAAMEDRRENKEMVSVKGGGFKKWFVRWGGLFCGQNAVDDKSRRRVGLFFESLLFYIGSICQQGLSFSTFFFSGRCIVITSLFFSFSIYQFYSASIVGTLLMEKPKTIRTLKDLIHSNLEIGVEDIVYNRDYFLRTKDPDAQELYAKKVTSVPTTGDTGFVDGPPDNFVLPTQMTEMTDAQKAKAYRDILHSHETGAHAKTNEASNWYDPDFGVAKIKKGRFAFHVDVATAYKIIADTFSEKEICDLTEIQLFPPQKMVSIVQKGSPLRKVITYGLRRVTEVGLTDYQRKVWHSPKPRCVKQLHTDDLRVDMQTFTSALLVLIFGYAVSLLILSLEIVHFKLWKRYTTT